MGGGGVRSRDSVRRALDAAKTWGMGKRRHPVYRLGMLGVLLIAAYVGSYFVLSMRGEWRWSQTGRLRYTFGLAVSDVERWFPAGVYWEPFRDIEGVDTSRGDLLGYFYSPLVRADRAYVHPDRGVFATEGPSVRR